MRRARSARSFSGDGTRRGGYSPCLGAGRGWRWAWDWQSGTIGGGGDGDERGIGKAGRGGGMVWCEGLERGARDGEGRSLLGE